MKGLFVFFGLCWALQSSLVLAESEEFKLPMITAVAVCQEIKTDKGTSKKCVTKARRDEILTITLECSKQSCGGTAARPIVQGDKQFIARVDVSKTTAEEGPSYSIFLDVMKKADQEPDARAMVIIPNGKKELSDIVGIRGDVESVPLPKGKKGRTSYTPFLYVLPPQSGEEFNIPGLN